MILGFFLFTRYDPSLFGDGTDSAAAMLNYGHFQDVHVMIFVGFGYLMTFLRKYGFSAVSFNFLMSVLAIQWYILFGGFIHKLQHGHGALDSKIEVNLTSLLTGDFAAGCVLITFGGMLGKASFPQLMVVTFFEVIFFALNEGINLTTFHASDMGGSVVLHTFGAYFGLAATWVLTPAAAKDHKENSSSRTSDLFSMIGTIFLWMYWPSFNSAPASAVEQQRCVINTVMSISASCVTACLGSFFLRKGKFNMVDVQNATLAGGVAIGTTCNMAVGIGGAVTTGCLAGILSAVGYRYIQPWLEDTAGITDTCGIHNLHGMPGVMAGISGIIVAAMAKEEDYRGQATMGIAFPGRGIVTGVNGVADSELRSASVQAGYQAACLATTLAIAIASGIFTGYVAKFLCPEKEKLFDDENHFEVPDDEIPEWAAVMASPTSRLLRRVPGGDRPKDGKKFKLCDDEENTANGEDAADKESAAAEP